jgi:hypothetical protein
MLSVCGFKFQKKASHVCRQTGGKTRTQDCGDEIAKIRFQDSAGDTTIRAHQIDDIAGQRREVAASGQWIENNAKGLFNPLPAASRDVRQHIIDMRVAPKGGSNAENEIIDHDLRVFPKCVTRRSDGEGRWGRRFILWVDIPPGSRIELVGRFNLIQHNRHSYKIYWEYIL